MEDEAIDRALAAMGDFASPYLVGHSSGVAELATAAARRWGFEAADLARIRRGALVHDLGRVAVPVRIWQKAASLTPDDWERVRLHAYHSERVLSRSPFLAALAPVATSHHERLDGSGLTEREAEVVGLLARGLQTKQVARALGISVKTADRHIQNAYGKIGASTRAAAALFAMEHGLVTGERSPFPAPPAACSVLVGWRDQRRDVRERLLASIPSRNREEVASCPRQRKRDSE